MEMWPPEVAKTSPRQKKVRRRSIKNKAWQNLRGTDRLSSFNTSTLHCSSLKSPCRTCALDIAVIQYSPPLVALWYVMYLRRTSCLHLWPSVLWRCWLGGRKGIRPVKNWVVGCWRSYLSEARCRLAYVPAEATATHCFLLQLNPDWFTFLVPAYPGSPGKRAVKWVCVMFAPICHG